MSIYNFLGNWSINRGGGSHHAYIAFMLHPRTIYWRTRAETAIR